MTDHAEIIRQAVQHSTPGMIALDDLLSEHAAELARAQQEIEELQARVDWWDQTYAVMAGNAISEAERERDEARAENERLREAITEHLDDMAIEYEDPRIGYVVVQVTRGYEDRLRSALAATQKERGPLAGPSQGQPPRRFER